MNRFKIAFFSILLLAIFVRLYQVTSFPPSLYWEEMALGYDAFSVLKTGKDHLGNPPPLVAFESYGDYKPALYFYLLLPSIEVFGLNEFAVRFPALLAGIFIVVGVGVLTRLVIGKYEPKRANVFQVVAMAVTALSPWAIQFSRAAWESNVATCFIVWGVVFCFFKKKWWYRFIGFFLFALSMYTYHSARVIAPLLGLGMMVVWLYEGFQVKKNVIVGLFFCVLIFPLLLSFTSKTTQERFAETSLFADGHVSVESNACRDQAHHSLASNIFCHRYLYTAIEIVGSYFSHFTADFLFIHGDKNLRHSTQFTGELYFSEAIFLFLGVVFFIRSRRKEFCLLIFWLGVGIIPAALTIPTPHALRILPVMPVFMILITCGIVYFYDLTLKLFQSKYLAQRLIFSAIIISYGIQFASFWSFYSRVYPKLYSGAWQYGYRQIVAEVQKRKTESEHVYFLREMDRPAMAYWFFTQTDPRIVQKIDKTLQKDQGVALPFENILFINFVGEARQGLVASTVESLHELQKKGNTVSDITYIFDPAGKPIWAVYKHE